MLSPRVIPCLLLKGKGLVKGVQFKNHKYIGDPINAVQIFNTKAVDELFFLDITATEEGRTAPLSLIEQISDHCLTPFAVGGGIRSLAEARAILKAGAEKLCLNTSALENPKLIREITDHFGSQSVAVSIDYKKNWLGQLQIYSRCGTRFISKNFDATIDSVIQHGAGEIILNSIERDGMMTGYDLSQIELIAKRVDVPVIAMGGAGNLQDIQSSIFTAGASAAAAGSMFVFHGRLKAVLISYPTSDELKSIREDL